MYVPLTQAGRVPSPPPQSGLPVVSLGSDNKNKAGVESSRDLAVAPHYPQMLSEAYSSLGNSQKALSCVLPRVLDSIGKYLLLIIEESAFK